MNYFLIENGEVALKEASCLQAILAKFNDMYKYSVFIGGRMIYVVVKTFQPTDWEIGWAQ